MKMVTCGCKRCRYGMRCKSNHKLITLLRRGARHKAKQDLKEGKEPAKTFYVPYLD